MEYAFRVDVYKDRSYIFCEEGVEGMTFGFRTFEEASAFMEQMIATHGKAVVMSRWTE